MKIPIQFDNVPLVLMIGQRLIMGHHYLDSDIN